MKIYLLISDSMGTPVAIYDDFEKARQYVLAHPSIHLCIFEYELNSTAPGKNIFDNNLLNFII